MNTLNYDDGWDPSVNYYVLDKKTNRLLFVTLVGDKNRMELVKFSFFPMRKGFKKGRHNVRILK